MVGKQIREASHKPMPSKPHWYKQRLYTGTGKSSAQQEGTDMRKAFLSLAIAMLLCLSIVPPISAAGPFGKTTFSSGDVHYLAIKTDGSLWVWGANEHGQIGNGTSDGYVSQIAPVKAMDDVVTACVGGEFLTGGHTLAVKSDGSLWAWGSNANGKLGDGTLEMKTSPVKIMDGVVSVSAGFGHSLAITEDDSLWGWGYTMPIGLGGPGNSSNQLYPVKIMDGVAAASAGGFHTLALKTDGSLWACGENEHGQIGNGAQDSANVHSFVKIMDGVVSISAGNYFSFAIKADGSLWAWGHNGRGQLGDGTHHIESATAGGFFEGIDKAAPIKIMDGVATASGSMLGQLHFSAAVKTDGSLWAWGGKDRYKPVKIMNDVVASDAIFVLKPDGSLRSIGDDENIVMEGVAFPQADASASVPATNVAKPATSTVLVNGENVDFDAYNIAGNNYFKLRDLAYTLSGTEKQFEVGWDGAANAITLTSGKPYTSVGGEMTGKGADGKAATPTTSKITLDGKDVSLTAYNIGSNNYFKLRDIGQTFDFGVNWDGAKNTIVIDTGKGYTPE
jgi:alpha-tubulin suppressor-like RCC1 family protein